MSVKIVKLVDAPVQFNFGGPNPQGEFNISTAYCVSDSVSYMGSSYIAIQSTTGNLPTDTTYWQILAEKGEQGIQGIQGEQGVSAQDSIEGGAPDTIYNGVSDALIDGGGV